MIIVLIGLPGSGKGTQAKLLCDELNFTKISVGDLLREEAKSNSEIRKLLSSGALLPGDTVDKIVEKALGKNNSDCVLDGYPRSISQTLFLTKNYTKDLYAVHLNIDPKDLLERIIGRYSCANCGAIYNQMHHSSVGKKCDFCLSEKFVVREDDNLETFQNRIQEYKTNTVEVIEYFATKGALATVDASGLPAKIFNQIKDFILLNQKKS
jgi:adenylate kinase